jgi:hypothetical protein
MPLGGTQKRQGSLFKGKKTKKKFYEGKVKDLMQDLKELSDSEFKEKYGKTKAEARQELKEDEVNEADLILVPGQGKKLKPGFIPKDQDRTDHEVEMARSDLYQAAKNAQKVYELIQHLSEEEGLEGWVQEKIIKANDYLNTIREYLEHKTYMQETTGGVLAGGMSNFEEGVRDLGYDAQSLIMKLRRDVEEKRLQPTPQAVLAAARELAGDTEFAPQLLVKQVLGQGVAESKCPKCGGPAFSEEHIAEAKDACYHKVKSRYKVWPSAYASGALVKCRKVGASNWGNKSKK